MIENVLVIAVLVMWSIEDIKKKSIDVRWLAGIGLVSLMYGTFKWIAGGCNTERMMLMAGAIFVVFLTVMSVGINALGLADMIIMCMLIVVKGVVFAVSTFMGAVTVLAIVVTVLFVSKKVSRKQQFAFVPYIGVSALGVMILG